VRDSSNKRGGNSVAQPPFEEEVVQLYQDIYVRAQAFGITFNY